MAWTKTLKKTACFRGCRFRGAQTFHEAMPRWSAATGLFVNNNVYGYITRTLTRRIGAVSFVPGTSLVHRHLSLPYCDSPYHGAEAVGVDNVPNRRMATANMDEYWRLRQRKKYRRRFSVALMNVAYRGNIRVDSINKQSGGLAQARELKSERQNINQAKNSKTHSTDGINVRNLKNASFLRSMAHLRQKRGE